MKVRPNTTKTRAFTLIEMIGVLAVIAILAALLIPKVFQAINEARINTVPVGASTCKTATIDHYAKYGALNTIRETAMDAGDIPYLGYDEKVLLAEGFLDKPFAPRVGTGADIVLNNAAGSAAVGDDAITYWLSGQGTATNEATGTYVVYAAITNVPRADAQAISYRIDGPSLSAAEGSTTNDIAGRVKYSDSDPTTVFIYLTHR